MNLRRVLAVIVALAAAAAVVASRIEERKRGRAEEAVLVEVRLDGALLRAFQVEEILRIPHDTFVDGYGETQAGPLLSDVLASAGVRAAKRVIVSGRGAAPLEFPWSRVTDPEERPTLATTHRGTLKLVGRGGPLADRAAWIRHVWSIDVLEPRLATESEILHIHVAASLGPAFDELAKEFERKHPGVEVRSETGASLLLARRVAELESPSDVLALADAEIFDEVLVPRGVVARYDALCGTRLGIVYTPRSKHAAELGAGNWHEVLRRPGVRVGRADPDAAPVGYRTLLLFQLAEAHYGLAGLAAKLLEASPRELVRPSASQLAGNVQAGELDYAFDYEATAAPRGLAFLALPREIDFSDPALAAAYAGASVEVAGAKPGERRRVRGAPIRYGIAVPAGAPEPTLAADFLRLVLGPRGREVLKRHAFLVDGR